MGPPDFEDQISLLRELAKIRIACESDVASLAIRILRLFFGTRALALDERMLVGVFFVVERHKTNQPRPGLGNPNGPATLTSAPRPHYGKAFDSTQEAIIHRVGLLREALDQEAHPRHGSDVVRDKRGFVELLHRH
jgi:hypothetical protein